MLFIQLLKAILENFDEFKQLHPAYADITKESLLDGISLLYMKVQKILPRSWIN